MNRTEVDPLYHDQLPHDEVHAYIVNIVMLVLSFYYLPHMVACRI